MLVGKDKRGNALTLEEMEKLEQKAEASIAASKGADSSAKDGASVPESTVSSDKPQLPTTPAPSKPPPNPSHRPSDKHCPRIRVSEKRIWYALTGHGVDWVRCPRSEFNALTVIASQRGRGILQTDLTVLTGQDKRSIPRRTDALKSKGYIEKKPAFVSAKSQRTSLLILRRFVRPKASPAVTTNAEFGSGATPAGVEAWTGETIDVNALLTAFFGHLKQSNLITRNDLKEKLGILRLRWQSHLLGRLIRRLEFLGYIKRVRAASEFSLGAHAHSCVKLLRAPDFKELHHLWYTSLKDAVRFDDVNVNDDADQEADDGGNSETFSRANPNGDDASGAVDGTQTKGALKEVGRVLPQWMPRRPMGHLLFDLLKASGTDGMSTMASHSYPPSTCRLIGVQAIKAHSLGAFFNRPMEIVLDRYTENFLLAQPPHLRHLAIVRDVAQIKRAYHYHYYTLDNFKIMVAEGQASMEDVTKAMKQEGKKGKRFHNVDARPQLDQHGFPPLDPKLFFKRDGRATLGGILREAKAEPLYIGGHDPIVFRKDDGKFDLDMGVQGRGRAPGPTPLGADGKPNPRALLAQDNQRRPLGRPRKYPKGEEPYNPEYKARMRREKQERLEEQAKKRAEASRATRTTKVAAQQGAPESALDDGQDRVLENVPDLGQGQRANGSSITNQSVDSPSARQVLEHERGDTVRSQASPTRHSDESTLGQLNRSTKRQRDDVEIEAEEQVLSSQQARPNKRPKTLPEVGAAVEATSALASISNPRVILNPPGSARVLPTRRGRKKQPMIAVFVSERLRLLNWFRLEAGDDDVPASGMASANSPAERIQALPHAARQSSRKRPFEEEDNDLTTEGGCEAITDMSVTHRTMDATPRRSARKRRQVERSPSLTGNRSESDTQMAELENVPSSVQPSPSLAFTTPSAARVPSSASQQPEPLTPAALTSLTYQSPSRSAAHNKAVRQTNPASSINENLKATVTPATPAAAPESSELTNSPLHHSISVQPDESPRLIESCQAQREESPTEASLPTTRATPESPPQQGSPLRRSAKKSRAKPNALHNQGSLMFKRKKIIMGLVDELGGVYPGDKELWYAYTVAWMKENPNAGKPDPRTLKAVQKSLVDAGQLKTITFSFVNSKGLQFQKRLLARPDLEPESAPVQELQKRMIEVDGEYYAPPESGVTVDLRKQLEYGQHGVYRAPPILKPIEKSNETVTLHNPTGRNFMDTTEKANAVQKKAREAYPARMVRIGGRRAVEEPVHLNPDEQREAAAMIRQAAESRWWYKPGSQGSRGAARLHGLDRSSARFKPGVNSHVSWPSTQKTIRPGQGTPKSRAASRYLWRRIPISDNTGPSAATSLAALAAPLLQTHFPTGTIGALYAPATAATPRRVYRNDAWRQKYSRYYALTDPEQPMHHPSGTFGTEYAVREFYITPKRRAGQIRGETGRKLMMLAMICPEQRVHGPSGTFGSVFQPGDVVVRRQRHAAASRQKKRHEAAKARAFPGQRVFKAYQPRHPRQRETRFGSLTHPEQTFHESSGTFGTAFLITRPWPDQSRLERQAQRTYNQFRPSSLDAIIRHMRRGRYIDHSRQRDPMWSEFEYAVDRVRVWEERSQPSQAESEAPWQFINHSIPSMRIPEGARNDHFRWNNASSTTYDSTHPPSLEEPSPSEERVMAQPKKRRRATESRKSPDNVVFADTTASFFQSTSPFKTRRLTSLEAGYPPDVERQDASRAGYSQTPSKSSTYVVQRRKLMVAARRRRRRPNLPSTGDVFTPGDDRRLLIAIAVIRTLVGGIGQLVDWVLVAKVMAAFDMTIIQRRWTDIRQRHESHMEKLQTDFQESYIAAYEANQLPPIDYDDLPNYDWNWLIDWAQRTLETPRSVERCIW